MQNERDRFTVLDVELMAALEVHCDAINALHPGCVDDYMTEVKHYVGAIDEELARVRYLWKISAAVNVTAIAPIATAVTRDQWNPIMLYAGAMSMIVVGAAASIKTGGDRALKDVVTMIRNCSRVIEERTCENAITRTWSTMRPLAELLKQKFGQEKVKAAYILLVRSLLACSKRNKFDLKKIPYVMREQINAILSCECSELVRNVQDPSRSLLTPIEIKEQFGTKLSDRVNSAIAQRDQISSWEKPYEDAMNTLITNYRALVQEIQNVPWLESRRSSTSSIKMQVDYCRNDVNV